MLKVITIESEWRKIVNLLKHDWYHTWDYHKMAEDSGQGKPLLVVYTYEDKTICLPLLLRNVDDVWFDATSVYGYPGFIASVQLNDELVESFICEIQQWAFKENIVSIFSRLNPCLESHNSSVTEVSGETVFIDLSLPVEEQRKKYRKNYRNLLNKLVKEGVTCRWSRERSDIDEFIKIYNNTMGELNASDSYYFDKQYYYDLISCNDYHTRVYSCYLNNEKICSGLFVFCGDIVQYHLSGTVCEYKKLAPTRLMLDTVRLDASVMGYNIFHLGGGLGGCRDSLFDFKYGFSKNAVEFRTLKMITNKDVYSSMAEVPIDSLYPIKEGFFPLYRKS